jgi:hypothetical protein
LSGHCELLDTLALACLPRVHLHTGGAMSTSGQHSASPITLLLTNCAFSKNAAALWMLMRAAAPLGTMIIGSPAVVGEHRETVRIYEVPGQTLCHPPTYHVPSRLQLDRRAAAAHDLTDDASSCHLRDNALA